MNEELNKIVVITGPTALGKTAVSIELAKLVNGEIVSADSAQAYKGMNIGTATPSDAELREARHHMINIIDPIEPLSAALFSEMARDAIDDIISRKRLPILVGGAGFYICSIIYENFLANKDTDKSAISEVEKLNSKEVLLRLKIKDPKSFSLIHPNNIKRARRALAFALSNNEPISKYTQEKIPRYNAKIFALDAPREYVYERINRRADFMIENGLLEEARSLNLGPTAKKVIGYKELEPYFNGQISLADCAKNIKQATRRYAKRQLTWLKKNPSKTLDARLPSIYLAKLIAGLL